MAEERRILEFAEANFDLLTDNDELNEVNLNDELAEEHMEAVQQIFTEYDMQQSTENQDSVDDFESESKVLRHANCNSEDLDNYSDANIKDTTKQQTKWAVSIFTGKNIFLSQKYGYFFNLKCSSRRYHYDRQVASVTPSICQCTPHFVLYTTLSFNSFF